MDNQTADSSGATPAQRRPLPSLTCPVAPDEVQKRLHARAARGKLAGYERVSASEFRIAAFGAPYDKRLIGRITPDPGQNAGSRVDFEVVWLKKLPAIMAVVVVLMFWPGVWLTDSLIKTYFTSYPQNGWLTAAWYLPLCALALPVLWKQWKGSGAAADEHARETVEALRGVLDAKAESGERKAEIGHS